MNLSQELSSFLHSHRLYLHPEMKHRRCDVCREPIEGTFYRCACCDFDVHPYCTRLPQQIRHAVDANHKLTLHKLSSGRCSICEADCSSLWVYGCSICRFNIHLQCVPKRCGSASGTRGMPHHFHAPGGYPNFVGGGYNGAYGVGNYNWYNHNTHYPPRPYNYYYNTGNPHLNYGGFTPLPSTLGSSIGGAMFALVENLAAGALLELVFGD